MFKKQKNIFIMLIIFALVFFNNIIVNAQSIFYGYNNGASMSTTFYGHYGGALDGTISGYADGGSNVDGHYYWATNRYIDSGRIFNFNEYYQLTFSVGGWAGTYYIYVGDNNQNWYYVGSIYLPYTHTYNNLVVNGNSLPIKNVRYFRAYSPNGGRSVALDDFAVYIDLLDITPPNISFSISNTNLTNSDVTITVSATDSESGVKYIKLPNGNIVYTSVFNYVVSENNTYTFEVQDNAGNIATRSITITNIDKELPIINTSVILTNNNSSGYIEITASDTISGVKSIKLPDNSYVYNSYAEYPINYNGDYTIEVQDNAGNKNVKTIQVRNIEKPLVLNAQSMNEDNYVKLNWNIDDTWQNYTYMIYSKKSTDTEFQTIPAKERVKVLHIYPGVGNNLKTWMETNGYGKGLITVDEINIDDFNNNPNLIFNYDVAVVGFWDCNNWKMFNNNAVQAITNFINQGKGFLAGHDTIGYDVGTTRSLGLIRDKFKIKVGYWNTPQYGYDYNKKWGTGGTKVKIVKKGLLTNYPWKIGDINTILTVPYTHTTSNLALGDIWMTIEGIDNNGTAPTGYEFNGRYYLTTWNNTAMIQTGHSNGQATEDEQKLIANTIFYLAQITDQTSWDDHMGQDVDAPNKPNIISVVPMNNSLTINFSQVVDNGTTYQHYIEATGSKDNKKIISNVTTTTITSGLKGYSIVVDNNPNTIPDTIIETTNNSYVTNNPKTGDFYVHVVAVDNVGNISEVAHYHYVDNTPPTIKITYTPTIWTNGDVTMNVEAIDEETGVKIKLPNNNWVISNNVSYTVNTNGDYTFIAENSNGLQTIQTIKISNIDKDKPFSPQIVVAPNNWTNNNVSITIINKGDNGSGVREIHYKLEGAVNSGWIKYEQPFTISSEGITIVKARTVDNVNNYSDEATEQAKIDRTPPENNSIKIIPKTK